VFTGAQTVCANITSTGTIVAQTLNVQQVTSSIVYSCGSNIFGCSTSDVQQMTGSVRITGSLNVTGNACFANCITACNAFIQVPSTAAVVDILRLNNPAVVSSGTRLKFENGYGDLAALRVIHMDNGSLADDGQIEFQTAQNAVLGTRMTILNSGLVGIGTLCPSAELQINKTCDVTVALSSCVNVTSGNRGSIAFYNCATSTVGLIRATAVTDNVGTQLEFHTRPAAGSLTQNVTISSVGQLLVNTTNWPSSVIGNSANRHMIGGATEPNLILWNEATAAANNQSNIWLGAKSATGATYIGGGVIQGGLENATNSCGYLAFRTTDTTAGTNERMRITAAGNVGIGITTPCRSLHVVNTSEQLRLAYDSTNTVYSDFRNDSAGGLLINTTGGYIINYIGGTERMRISDNCSVIIRGSFGICNGGAINMTIPNGNNGGSIRMACCTGANEGDMYLTGGGGVGILIAGSGTVGIGTVTPCTTLDIRGSGEGIYVARIAAANFGPHVRMQKARGTVTSPTIVSNGDTMGSLTFEAYNGSGYSEATGIRGIVNGAVSAGVTPTDLFFAAGPNGTTAQNERMRITSGGLILACGRMSSILASNGNIQEYVGTIGAVANNTGWSLFCINNQYDVLAMDIFVFTDVGSFQASKHNVVFGYTQFANNAIGFASAFCIFSAGTLYFETMRICNLSGSGTNLQRVAVRVWGYGVGQDGSGGSNLLNTSCLIRIK